MCKLKPQKIPSSCNYENGISRKQRAYYAVQGGLDDVYIENNLRIEVKKIHKSLIEAIDRLNKFTHIEPKTFNVETDKIDNLVCEVTHAVSDFINLINECRKTIITNLWEHIDSAVVDETLKETIQEIDELASHHYLDEVYTDKVEIYAIDHESIMFRATGSISCELQFGSNSDLRRGDGAISPESFEFTCELISPVDEPNAVESVDSSLSDHV